MMAGLDLVNAHRAMINPDDEADSFSRRLGEMVHDRVSELHELCSAQASTWSGIHHVSWLVLAVGLDEKPKLPQGSDISVHAAQW
jgi:hypothetical protein